MNKHQKLFYYTDILKCLNKLDSTLIGQEFCHLFAMPRIICRHLNKSSIIPTKLSYSWEMLSHFPEDIIGVGASYDDELDEDGKSAINLQFLFSKKSTSVLITKDNWCELKIDIADSLEHEMVHLTEFRQRDFICDSQYLLESKYHHQVFDEEVVYFSDEGEIHAYAINAAREIFRNATDKNQAYSWLRIKKQTTKQENILNHPVLSIYRVSFAQYPKVIHEFYRWVFYYLNELYLGIAQPGRVLDLESRSRRFKSSFPDHTKTKH